MFNPSNESHFSVQIQGLQHDFQVLGFTGPEAISTPYQLVSETMSRHGLPLPSRPSPTSNGVYCVQYEEA
ncbi:hypothetical protein AX279_10440 [Pseudomonas sp. J237]|nr:MULTISPECIES: hypothetical protein [Pseudomonas]OEO25841.1 hypothetical protein AX279_10440 [Pseudomonas sp. J237]